MKDCSVLDSTEARKATRNGEKIKTARLDILLRMNLNFLLHSTIPVSILQYKSVGISTLEKGGGEVLPDMDNTGMYRWIGYGFLPLCPGARGLLSVLIIQTAFIFSLESVLTINRVLVCTTDNCPDEICLYFKYTKEITIALKQDNVHFVLSPKQGN